ncbi:xanthine dehydrogenase family protein molybdopterin-binding subunit [Microvirga tunisiensis]|uniref:Xanthine dehydrogenase family protein molybdopterin-binding subunit n=1 Tax=Microvirga tunisiensis TaxID=2108360 RepID=A0A5N7M9S9_9HYPH|nr:xanthine dehydrogenase family protein molybdopterin-binding subunit [Microvirga tunisiensis]MPR05452.1 xanthine dehydrogenase family protein molybdopterin-binding subunit [Microvirga tunisiensis]MPR23653.1 xanthine dehydrogenase family protein molybdopterin-binding subunit [Microvirga tunisiensis]
MSTAIIGMPLSRVDGRKKVTGSATYAAEFDQPGQAYAAIARSTIAAGRIVSIDLSEAEQASGVVAILTHQNAPKLPYRAHKGDPDPVVGERLHVLQSNEVNHQGQPVALVVADRLEQALHAASLVRVVYASATASTDATQAQPVSPGNSTTHPSETRRGDADAGLAAAEVKVDQTYVIPRQYHNPLETHATVAAWDGDKLTLWDKTQWLHNVADEIASVFDISSEDVRVISPFVGGAFGAALRTWPHVTLAALAARVVGRPVKLMLSRREMYYGVGYRPYTVQRFALGASRDGRLTAILHDGWQETSTYEEFRESLPHATKFLYSCSNVYTRHRLAPLNVHTPTYMRAPGEASGIFAMESAMDELAFALGIDPVELRLRNEPTRDEAQDRPFSSRSMQECYRLAAERFGWSQRNPQPRSMRDGHKLIGWGVASATYPVHLQAASALVRLLPDGTAEVVSAASDMGPGTWTTMTQIAAETLRLPVGKVRFNLGDTKLPRASVHGGSMTTASVGSAVQGACQKARASILANASTNDIAEAIRRLEHPYETLFHFTPGDAKKRFSMHAFGAVFAEVAVDPDLCEARVNRIVGSYGLGRIVNPKTTRSQVIGGMVGGIGMALMEHSPMDRRNGRAVNANLAEYAIPVHADNPPEMEAIFIDEHDPHVNPLGVKGVGEIAIVGVAPAIANAIFHATGKRIRELPITPDKLL